MPQFILSPLKTCVLIVFALLFVFFGQSAILPLENSRLSYRLVGFRWEQVRHSGSYKLEVALGNFPDIVSFKNNITLTRYADTNRCVVELPLFNREYTWRISCDSGFGDSQGTVLHHFSARRTPELDTNVTRLRITHHTVAYPDMYVVSDGAKAIYDLEGNLVWGFPVGAPFVQDSVILGDFKPTATGTFTFITNDLDAYEIDYDGRIKFQLLHNAITTGQSAFHHEFTKLANGHYMVLGSEQVLMNKSPDTSKGSVVYRFPNKVGAGVFAVPFSTVAEYDKNKKQIWAWHLASYFQQSELNRFHGPFLNGQDFHPHLNSFWLDENSHSIYLSFRNINRVIKIGYPDGKVQRSYGETYTDDAQPLGNLLFNGQHSVKLLSNGSLCVYNNNSATAGDLPKLIVMKEPAVEGQLEQQWEYDLDLSGLHQLAAMRLSSRGGNVLELPQGAFFIAMNMPFGKALIVNAAKEVQWCGVFEHWDNHKREWCNASQYRASVINGASELERLVFGDR